MKRLLIVLAVIVGVSVVGTLVGRGGALPGIDSPGAGSDQAEEEGDGGDEQRTAAEAEPEEEAATVDTSGLQRTSGTFVLLSPGTGSPGTEINVTGAGFDPGATVDLSLKPGGSDQDQEVGFVEVTRSGSFTTSFTIPDDLRGGEFVLTAEQDGGNKTAETVGTIHAGAPEVELGTLVGQPGDDVTLSGSGFEENETVRVYLNSTGGEPLEEYRTSDGGDLGRDSFELPFAPPGNANLIFVGEKSQAPVTVQVLMLNLFPTVTTSSYAAKPGNDISFSGEGFGPNETVAVYLNSTGGTPITTFETTEDGTFSDAGHLEIPYELRGTQTFILRGNQSQAASTVSFNVLPFTPNAEPSAFGARPGTTISFYGEDFAPNEVVRVIAKRNEGDPGEEVSCFKVNQEGQFRGAGSYRIPADAGGEITLLLRGDTSDATAEVALEVTGAGGSLSEGEDQEEEYRCPFSDEGEGNQGGEEDQRGEGNQNGAEDQNGEASRDGSQPDGQDGRQEDQ